MKDYIINPPENLAVPLRHAKDTLRITHDGEDEHLTSLIGSATTWIEGLTGKALIEQTRRVVTIPTPNKRYSFIAHRRGCHVKIPSTPLVRIEDVQVNHTPVENYSMCDATTVVFPPIKPPGEVSITYRTGYGPCYTYVPLSLYQAVLIGVVRLYEDMTLPPDKEVHSLISPFIHPIFC